MEAASPAGVGEEQSDKSPIWSFIAEARTAPIQAAGAARNLRSLADDLRSCDPANGSEFRAGVRRAVQIETGLLAQTIARRLFVVPTTLTRWIEGRNLPTKLARSGYLRELADLCSELAANLELAVQFSDEPGSCEPERAPNVRSLRAVP